MSLTTKKFLLPLQLDDFWTYNKWDIEKRTLKLSAEQLFQGFW